MKQTAILDVRQFIDERPLSRYQLLVALMCGGCASKWAYGATVTLTPVPTP